MFYLMLAVFVIILIVNIYQGPWWMPRRSRGVREVSEKIEALHANVEELRAGLLKVEERLDFTERMLAQQGRKALPPEA